MFAKKQTSFPCDICPKSYKQFNTLKNHKSTVHKVEVQNWKSEKENFRGVTITPRQTTTRGSLRKIVSCNVCGTQFQSVEQLAKHLVSGVHGTDKCNICQKKFSSVHFLAKHLVSGDHGKDKEARKPVKNNTKVVDVIDVDLEEEPLKFNIPQIVKKVDSSKKRKSAGDEIAIKKKAKVDKVIVDDEPRHWLDKMMKEVDDFSTNLLSLIGDVRKTWGSGVKNDQCVTEATEKLREVLMISKNYIELIDKSVIDEYWANQSGLWGQIPTLDEVPAPVLDEGANVEEEATLEETLDDNGDSETVCTPDLPDMEALDLEADVDINLDGEPVFESLEESSEVIADNIVAEGESGETLSENITNDEDLTNSTENYVNYEELTSICDDETVDESVSNTNEETATNLVLKTDNEDGENNDSIEDLSENECKLKPSEVSVVDDHNLNTEEIKINLEVDTHSEEHSKKNDMDEKTTEEATAGKGQLDEDKREEEPASEEEVTSNTEEKETLLAEEEENIEAEENDDQDRESEENAREEVTEEEKSKEDLTEEVKVKEELTEEEKPKDDVTEEENVKEEVTKEEVTEEENSKEQTEKGNAEGDVPSDLPKKESTGMFLFASWCQ